MAALIYFLFILLILVLIKNKSILIYLVLIQVISLFGAIIIDQDYIINNFVKTFNLIFTLFILSIILFPWIKIDKIYSISVNNDIRVMRLTYFMIVVSIIPFIVFLFMTIFLIMHTENIYLIRSVKGELVDTYASMQMNSKLFTLSRYLYPISYFLIPLHIFYLGKQKRRLSFLCFVFSLNILLYGLTYYSRSVFVHYIFIYLGFLYMLRSTLDVKEKLLLKKSLFMLLFICFFYLIYITSERFGESTFYYNKISSNSLIQDPLIYSYVDYMSQWYSNSMSLLETYMFVTFKGQISFKSILDLIGNYTFINYDVGNYIALIKTLWPNNWYTFNGLVAYSVYDYGYMLTILLSFIYFFVISSIKLNNNQIDLNTLFILILLIQIPLMSIFYTTVDVLIMPALYLMPIYFYLRGGFNRSTN